MKKTYKIEVDCVACADKMEEASEKVPGVKDASINFIALKLKVDFEEGVDPDQVMEEVLKSCKKIERDCEIYF